MKKTVLRVLTLHWWLGMTVAAWAFLMFASGTPRGFDRYGVVHLERVDAAREWLAEVGQGTSPFAAEPAARLLVSEPFHGPLNGVLPAVLGRFSGGDADTAALARLANMLLVCLAAWCLFSIGRRAGGLLAGIGAAVALIAVPRVWGAATSPGYTATALFTITLAAMCMAHARDRLPYLIPALLAVAAALLTTQLAWLLLLPWVYLTFFDARPSGQGGVLRPRPLALWAPFVFPAAVVLALMVFGPFREGGAAAVGDYLKAFVRLPREPTLYFGELYDAERLPWHASIALTLFTTPPTVMFLAVFGITLNSPVSSWIARRTRRSTGTEAAKPADVPSREVRTEALRLSWSMLVLTLAVPLLMGTTHSHGIDLLALSLPWWAVYAGVGLAAVLRVIAARIQAVFAGRSWARIATLAAVTTLGWGVFVFAFKDTQSAYPEVESYYNWLVDGVDGAAELGLPRNPHGPTPPAFLAQLVESDAAATVALVPGDGSEGAVLDRYRRHGLVPEGLWPAPLEAADLVVFRYDDQAGGSYRLLPDLYATMADTPPERIRWLRREGLPLFVALRLGR